MTLQGKIALMTGAGRGIGRAIARALCQGGRQRRHCRHGRGCRPGRRGRDRPQGASAAPGRDPAGQIDAAIAATVARFGRLDILVNNAGIFDLAPIVEITRESYHRVFAVNVEGLLFTLQAAARQMIDAGRRRQDHQLRVPGRAARRGAGRRLLRVQGRGDQPDAKRRAGSDPARHQRQRDRAGRGGQRALGPCRCPFRSVRGPAAGREEAPRRRRPSRSAAWRSRRRSRGLAAFLASADADYIVAQTYNIDGGNWMA